MLTDVRKAANITKYILLATLVAGVLDISLACLNAYLSSGAKPSAVLRFVASGIYGKTSFTGGEHFELIGLALHFLITLAFVLLYPAIVEINSRINKHWLISGIVYGILICLFMQFVVVPMSNIPQRPFAFFPIFKLVLIQIVATGIPITYIFHRFNRD